MRLPDAIAPKRYTLKLNVDPALERFTGEVSIELRAARATQEIVLHARGLEIERAELRSGQAQRARAVEVERLSGDLIALRAERALKPDQSHTLTIAYSGRIDEEPLRDVSHP